MSRPTGTSPSRQKTPWPQAHITVTPKLHTTSRSGSEASVATRRSKESEPKQFAETSPMTTPTGANGHVGGLKVVQGEDDPTYNEADKRPPTKKKQRARRKPRDYSQDDQDVIPAQITISLASLLSKPSSHTPPAVPPVDIHCTLSDLVASSFTPTIRQLLDDLRRGDAPTLPEQEDNETETETITEIIAETLTEKVAQAAITTVTETPALNDQQDPDQLQQEKRLTTLSATAQSFVPTSFKGDFDFDPKEYIDLQENEELSPTLLTPQTHPPINHDDKAKVTKVTTVLSQRETNKLREFKGPVYYNEDDNENEWYPK